MTKTLIARPEHKGTSSKKTITGLYTGVSAVALMLGVVGNDALAAGTTITKPTTSFTVGTKQQFDFVDIHAPIGMDVVNNGTIGPGDSPSLTVDGPNGGSVGGNIINNNVISGTSVGIAISSTSKVEALHGAILNFGVINVTKLAAVSTSAVGINVSGPNVITSIINTGTINVSLTGSGTGTHAAKGINVISGGNLNANITNSGQIDVEDFWGTGPTGQDAQATAIDVSNTSAGTTANISVTNSGQIFLDSTASDLSLILGLADADALGVAGVARGSGSSANVSLVNTTNAVLSVEASAAGFGSLFADVDANATGARLSAIGGVTANVSMTNSGFIHASAFATGAGALFPNINATAVGTSQVGIATTSTLFNDLDAVNNLGGTIDVRAQAVGAGFAVDVTAAAAGGPQFAFGGAAITIDYTNSGSILVSALATGTGALADVLAQAGGLLQTGSGTSGTVTNTLNVTNSSSGIIDVDVHAAAFGGFASATASAVGVSQSATGGVNLSSSVVNAGLIDVDAIAVGTGFAIDGAAFATGVAQFGGGLFFSTFNGVSFTNESNATLSVAASVTVTGTFADVSTLSAFGVVQTLVGGNSISGSITNNGLIDVFAEGNASGFTATALATAGAFRQNVSATTSSTSIALGIANAAFANGTTTFTGSINVTASASASGSGADAFAGVGGSAVMVQKVGGAPGGSNVTIGITNQGNMDFNYLANAVGTSADANTDRISGYWQQINGTASTAAATFSNATGANFSVNATAIATGANASASATAIGGWQTITGGQSASATVNNDGSFNVRAFASAGGNSPFASASLNTGIYQSVNANGGAGSTASATITNTSFLSLDLDATATAVGSTFANASASIGIAGVFQGASGETATVSFNNSGAITMDVNAFAAASTASADASAFASIETGIQQSASAPGGDQLSASVSFTNSGDLEMNAFASAKAPDDATATARLDIGVGQYADTADNASVSFENTLTGSVSVYLSAFASGTDVFAQASNSSHIFEMHATAADDQLSASVDFTNDGDIMVDMFAHAFGTSGSTGLGASASAQVELSYAFELSASDAADVSIDFSNSGDIVFNLTVLASNANDVDASLDFDTMFTLDADGNSAAGDVASTSFTNSGLIDINGNATADGGTNADATANLDYFLYDFARQASSATVDITNSVTGVISIDLVANATATNGFASADATLSSFASVSANGNTGDMTLSDLNFTNDGEIDVNLTANAIGTTIADAQAGVAYGFTLEANGGDDASVDFLNTGDITFDINAFASGNDASATVDFSYPFIISATASDLSTSATVNFTNSATGSILVDLDAHARGTNGTSGLGAFADASADISTAFTALDAFTGFTASSTFQNDGSITFSVGAIASNAVDASASAEIGYGIDQSVTATGGVGSSATATINNTSLLSLNFIITAQAFGSTDADALASFDDTMIEQDADNADIAAVAFTNSGAFNVLVQATAVASNGQAEADASIDDGMSQSATASGGDNTSATVEFTNTATGVIDWTVKAVATALGTTVANDTADADVTIDDFLYQDADQGDDIRTSFTNDGTINVIAMASALGQDANATANGGEFLSQDANNNTGSDQVSGTVEFTNTGDITIITRAIARGTDGSSGLGWTADASATQQTVFSQNANNSDTETISFINSATGTIDIQVIAMASNVSDASANAELSYGIYQTQGTHGSPNNISGDVTIDNDGTISFLAWAQATGTNTADAYASFDNTIIYQSTHAVGNANTLFDNSGTLNILVQATAVAASGDASALATFDDGVEQYAFADAGSGMSASVTFNNSGVFSLVGMAKATGSTSATASAYLTASGFYQSATADGSGTVGGSASVVFNNTSTGSVDFQMLANAVGTDVYALASFSDAALYQTASEGSNPGSTASVLFQNDGSFNVLAQATAHGTPTGTTSLAILGQTATAYASMNTFIEQYAYNAFTGSATLNNNSSLSLTLIANASNARDAYASANLSYGIYQTAQGNTSAGSTATSIITNTSNTSLDFTLSGFASGVTDATAYAYLNNQLVFQTAEDAEVVSVLFDNNGLINPNSGSFSVDFDAVAIAVGNGANGNAYASAYMNTGVYQFVDADSGGRLSANATFMNTGSIVFDFNALAIGTTSATAYAYLNTAFWQDAEAGADVNLLFSNNTGSIDLRAKAFAQGSSGFVTASATATRVWQTVSPTGSNISSTLTFENKNSASFVVDASAIAINASTSYASANAFAAGVSQDNSNTGTQPTFNAVFVNADEDAFTGEPSTLFSVHAFASAVGGTLTNSADAFASGYRVNGDVDSNPVLDVTNNSTFRVFATAIGSTATATAIGMSFAGGSLEGTINNGGLIDVRASAPGGDALAIAVQFDADVNNTVFTNTGVINILAIGSTTAVAVGYVDSFTDTKPEPDAFTATSLDHASFINDGGTITAVVNSSGTISFGTAIDTTGAPNAVWIKLQGNNKQGNIWGNIEMSGDDGIWVTNGKTMFTGNVNASGTMIGDLTIGTGGTLTLASTGTGGAQVNVDTYLNTGSGTLAFNVTPGTPSSGLGQVYARTATLAGTVQLNIAPGLYANSQTYQDVVVASSSLSGTYTNTTINTNTPLLSLTAQYPGDGTVDLTLTRNSFASPAGMTINQRSAGLGLDGGYSTALTGAFGSMISNLFSLSTAAYIGALEQLHGSEHVQNLRSNLWSVNLMNYALDERVNAGTFSNDRTNNSDSVIRRGETTFWASYQGTTGDLEGDVEASGYKITQDGFYAGFDHSITDDILVGFAAGFYRSRLNFTNGSDKDDEGVQLAVYGAYDNQDFYVRGNFSLGYYNADVNRMINLPTQIGVARGDYNVNVMSFHAEAGKRLEIKENVYVTPFIGFTYASAENKAFSEQGLTGANLALPDNKVKSFTGDIGARFAASYQTGSNSVIIPEFYVKYRHEFKDEILSINSSFAGASGSGFSVISSRVDSSEYIVGGGVTFSQGDKLEVRLMYTGRFNSQITEHAIGLRLSLLLGNRK